MRSNILLLPFLSVPAIAQYGPPQVISGNYPGVMAEARMADIDQDGQLDMIGAAPYEQAMMWYRCHSPGRFEPGRAAISALPQPSGFDLADLNADGVEDLVVTEASGDLLLVARNNGYGEYPVLDTVPSLLDQPEHVRVIDLDADGDPDLVVASSLDDRIAWYANDGTGHFGTQQDITTGVDGATRFVLGDVDGDGDPDVLAGSPEDFTVNWFANDGSGSFAPASLIGTLNYELITTELADLNGDALADVLVAHQWDQVGYYPNTGAGSFGALIPIDTVNGLEGAWAADYDGDGDHDVLAGHFCCARMFANDGVGTFSEVALGEYFTVQQALHQDLDGDGLVDLVYVNGATQTLSYHYNQGGFTFSAPTEIPAYFNALGVVPADLDDDGDTDLLVSKNYEPQPTFLRNEGNGVFFPVQVVGLENETTVRFFTQDLDQDGLLDVMLSDNYAVAGRLYWRRNLGGTFAPEVLIQEGYLIENARLTLADVDADGDLDHIVDKPHLGWHRNDNGVFSALITIDATMNQGPSALADIDGDGDGDIIADDMQDDDTQWYRNNGNAVFTEQAEIDIYLDETVGIHPADLDGDGDLDLVLNGIFNEIERVLNNGNGTFGPPQDLNTWNWTNQVIVHDVDGDGDLDVMNANYSQFRYYANDGLGNFTGYFPAAPDEVYSLQLNSAALADIDGDGLVDIVYAEDVDPQLEWMPNRLNSWYRIQGRLFLDYDEDGVRDPNDPPIPWAGVVAEPAPNFPLAANNGTYLCYVDSGTYVVRPVIDTTMWRITSDSAQYTVHLSGTDPVSAGNDFGIAANSTISNVVFDFTSGTAPCSDTVHQYLSFANLGSSVERGLVALDYDTLHTYLSAWPPPDSIVGDRYHWSFNGLEFNEVMTIELTSILPSTDHLGELSLMHAELHRQDTSGVVTDTLVTEEARVIQCSYDPNDKLVTPAGYGLFGALPMDTPHLDYTIRFQNTGNATAHTVELRDTLDLAIDQLGLELLGYSYPPTDIRVDSNRVLHVRLQGINLPDSASDMAGSQGFVQFRAALVPGLPHGTEITNTGAIYFDLNPPVITNTVLNTLVDCQFWQPQVYWWGAEELGTDAGDAYQWYVNGQPIPAANGQSVIAEQAGNYSAQVTNVYGCVATTPEYSVLSTGIGQPTAQQLQVMPNPVKDEAVLIAPFPLTSAHVIEWSDVHGRVLRSERGNGARRMVLARQGLTAGVYLLTVKGPGESSMQVRVILR